MSSRPTGKARWSRETISKLLRNEKYVGDAMLQKTFVLDLFFGKQIKNHGAQAKFLIQGHHPAIVSRELFAAVNQAENADSRWASKVIALSSEIDKFRQELVDFPFLQTYRLAHLFCQHITENA